MRKVGILGGTFDPPHLGHLIIADEVRLALDLDEVWFIPTSEPPHKSNALSSAIDRVKMIELAIKDNIHFKVNTIEIEQAGRSYTYNTISFLKEAYPDIQFYFIIGADMVEYLPKWWKIDDLVDLIAFVGVNRPGYRVETDYPIVKVDVPMIDISSSFIRDRILNRESVNYFIPNSVYDYIKENFLYEAR